MWVVQHVVSSRDGGFALDARARTRAVDAANVNDRMKAGSTIQDELSITNLRHRIKR